MILTRADVVSRQKWLSCALQSKAVAYLTWSCEFQLLSFQDLYCFSWWHCEGNVLFYWHIWNNAVVFLYAGCKAEFNIWFVVAEIKTWFAQLFFDICTRTHLYRYFLFLIWVSGQCWLLWPVQHLLVFGPARMFASKMKTQYARSSAVGPLEVNVCKSVFFFLNMSASLLILRAPVGYVAMHGLVPYMIQPLFSVRFYFLVLHLLICFLVMHLLCHFLLGSAFTILLLDSAFAMYTVVLLLSYLAP